MVAGGALRGWATAASTATTGAAVARESADALDRSARFGLVLDLGSVEVCGEVAGNACGGERAAQLPSAQGIRPPRRPALPSSRVHPYAPRRPFRVHQDMRKGRRLPHDVLTLTSHTTDDKAPTDQAPEPPEGSAHDDAVILRQLGGQHRAVPRRACLPPWKNLTES